MRTQEEAKRLAKNIQAMFTRFGNSYTEHDPDCKVYITDADVYDPDQIDHCVEYLEKRNIYPMWYEKPSGKPRFVIQVPHK